MTAGMAVLAAAPGAEAVGGVRVPPIDFVWLDMAGGDLVAIAGDVLGLALIVSGVWLVLAVVAWAAARLGFSPSYKDSAFFAGGVLPPLLAAALIGSLRAAVAHGINLVDLARLPWSM